jgi:hypothetical protein
VVRSVLTGLTALAKRVILITPDKFSLMATADRRLSEAHRNDLLFRKSGSLSSVRAFFRAGL